METLFAQSSLSEQSRVWFYIANQPLAEELSLKIAKEANQFIAQWQTHGKSLVAEFHILFHQALVLMVDEAVLKASGCSIDSSVRFFQKLDAQYQLDLFDRFRILAIQGKSTYTFDARKVDLAIQTQKISTKSLILNTTIQNKKELNANGLIPLADSWVKNYLS